MWDKTDSGVRAPKGFTLIELMIIMAIVGILAAVAIPAYQDYINTACVQPGNTCDQEDRQAAREYAKKHSDRSRPVVTPEPHEFVEGISKSYTKCIGGTVYLITEGTPVQVLDSDRRSVPCSE